MKFTFKIQGDTSPSLIVKTANFLLSIAGELDDSYQTKVAAADVADVDTQVAEVTATAAPEVKPKKSRAKAKAEPEEVAEEVTEEPATEEVAEEAATEAETTTGGKNYTEPELQKLAGFIARTQGAGIVKDKITEIGGARIADLNQTQLNQLGEYLDGLAQVPY